MHALKLTDGRVINARRISDLQLAVDLDFAASRERPVIIEVVGIDGEEVTATRLAVLDTHSIWLSHQAEIAPRSANKPAIRTGLSTPEGRSARELFQRLSRAGSPALYTTDVLPGEEPRTALIHVKPLPQPDPSLHDPDHVSSAPLRLGGRLHTVKLVLEIMAVAVTIIGGIIGIIALVLGSK